MQNEFVHNQGQGPKPKILNAIRVEEREKGDVGQGEDA